MRSPSTSRVCQFVYPLTRRVCLAPLSGRGRHRYCVIHGPIVREMLRRARNPIYQERWRCRRSDLYRSRRWIYGAVRLCERWILQNPFRIKKGNLHRLLLSEFAETCDPTFDRSNVAVHWLQDSSKVKGSLFVHPGLIVSKEEFGKWELSIWKYWTVPPSSAIGQLYIHSDESGGLHQWIAALTRWVWYFGWDDKACLTLISLPRVAKLIKVRGLIYGTFRSGRQTARMLVHEIPAHLFRDLDGFSGSRPSSACCHPIGLSRLRQLCS